MQALYRDRGAVQARFAARCVTRTMIGALMNATNAVVLELDEEMGAIVEGREVPGLKKNAAFEAFEEEGLLVRPGVPRVIFAHEQNSLRRMEDQDTFESLPNASVEPSNE